MLADLHLDLEKYDFFQELLAKDIWDTYHMPERDSVCNGIFQESHLDFYTELQDLDYNFTFPISAEFENKRLKEGLTMSEIQEKYPEVLRSEFGTADNVDQIKEYFKDMIEDPDRHYAIGLSKISQDKSLAGKYCGWRWKKWGQYIGNLNPQCEYLADEDFGEDFPGYIIHFHIFRIPEERIKNYGERN